MSFRCILSAAILVFSEGLILRGPISPLVAQPGGVLQLPCSVETPLPLDELEVEWRRADSKELVHLFQEGQSRPESQSDAYRDRAHFFRTREIAEGNYSILLRNVTSDDVGIYSCGVYRKEETDEIAVEIEIERLVLTGADHAVSAYAGEEVILNCFVDSHIPPEEVSWFKVDSDESHMLVLLFQDNETYPGDSSYQGRTEFFTSEIPKGDFSLRLKDVRTEDKGEYICKAFSGLLSANTTVMLQVALVSALILLNIKDISQRALMHYVMVFGPSVLMFTAFVLWGVIEGFRTEVVTCSALNLIRFNLLFKTNLYQEGLPVTAYSIWIAVGKELVMTVIGVAYGLSSLLMGGMILKEGRVFNSPWEVLECVDLLYFFTVSFLSFTFSGSAYISMLAGIVVIPVFSWFLLRIVTKKDPFMKKSALFELFWLGWYALRRLILSVVVFYFFDQSLERNEERAGLLSVTVLLQLLALSILLDSIPPSLPETPKTILYMYGAFGVVAVNAITLATELILKSRKGRGTLTDLRVILLPFECVFVLSWIALWSHAYWTIRRNRIKQEVAIIQRYGCRRWLKFLKDGAEPSELHEMLSQSAPPPAGSDTPQVIGNRCTP